MYKMTKLDDAEIETFRKDLAARMRQAERAFPNRETAANAANVAKSTFQRWVDAKASPLFESVATFAKAADVSLDWLAFGDSEGFTRDLEEASNRISDQASRGWFSAIYSEIKELYVQRGWNVVPDDATLQAANIYFAVMERSTEEARLDALVISLNVLKGVIKPPPQTSDESQRSA